MKSLKNKIFITLLFSIVFFTIISINVVKAANVETDEGKILKYDARTKEITEVNVEEIDTIANLQKNTDGKNIYKIDAYDPLKEDSKNLLSDSTEPLTGRMITDTSSFPYRTTCDICTIERDNNGSPIEIWGGTASLVGPNTVLTAAHMVFSNNKTGEFKEGWTCYPAYNNGEYKNYSSGYSEVYFPSSYLLNDDKSYDWAICVLSNPLGENLGYFGLQYFDDHSQIMNMPITVTGYPGVKQYGFDGKTQWEVKGNIFEENATLFKFKGFLVGGYSGSPVWKTDDKTIIGVATMSNYSSYGQAVFTNRRIITLVVNLRNEWENSKG